MYDPQLIEKKWQNRWEQTKTGKKGVEI